MFTIGLTGNISCGKSSISKILASRGAVIIDADLLSREIYDYEDVLGEMRSSFPESIIDGKIDRKILGSIVFSDKTRLSDLNRISHKKIHELVCQALENNKDEDLVVVDAALLLEAKFDSLVDKVVLVYCDEEKQVERLINRDSISREDALKRIESQMSQEEKKKMADYLVDNSGDMESLEGEVEKLIKKIRKWMCEGEGKEVKG